MCTLHISALPFLTPVLVRAVPTEKRVRKAGKVASARQLAAAGWKLHFLSRALKHAAGNHQESQAGFEKFPDPHEVLAERVVEKLFGNPYPSTGTEKSLSGIRSNLLSERWKKFPSQYCHRGQESCLQLW